MYFGSTVIYTTKFANAASVQWSAFDADYFWSTPRTLLSRHTKCDQCVNLLFYTEIHEKVKNGVKPYFRPTLEESDCPCDELAVVIRRCWAEDPMERPDFQALKSIIRKLNKWVWVIRRQSAWIMFLMKVKYGWSINSSLCLKLFWYFNTEFLNWYGKFEW